MDTWVQKDGTPIAVSDMADGHVINAMRMLGRKKHVMEVMWFIRLRDEIRTRVEKRNHDAAMETLFDPWGDN